MVHKEEWNPQEMGLGENLRRLRTGKRWSQQTLADRCLISASMIERYEAGQYSPSLHTLCKIKRALECSYDELLEEPETLAVRKIMQALSEGEQTAETLARLSGRGKKDVRRIIEDLRTEVKIFGRGTSDDPYTMTERIKKRPYLSQINEEDRYSEEELREIWRRLKCEEDAVEKLCQFALCGERKAREMIGRWGK